MELVAVVGTALEASTPPLGRSVRCRSGASQLTKCLWCVVALAGAARASNKMQELGALWFPNDAGNYNLFQINDCLVELGLDTWEAGMWDSYKKQFVATDRRRLWSENETVTVQWASGSLRTSEPCNGVSNLAYYQEACSDNPDGASESLRVANPPFARLLVSLGFGSFAIHTQPQANFTRQLDRSSIRLIGATGVAQLTGAALPDVGGWLDDAARAMRHGTAAPQRGPYKEVFARLFALLLRRAFPEPAASVVIALLNKALLTGDDLAKAAAYRPSVKWAAGYERDALSVLVTMMHAFAWQETTLPFESTVQALDLNRWLGKASIRAVGGGQLQRALYPGQAHCRSTQSHSKWHELSAKGLADLGLLIHRLGCVTLTCDGRSATQSP